MGRNNELEEKLKILKKDENYIKIIEKELHCINNKEAKDILKNIINFTKENNCYKAYPWAVFNLGKIYIEESEYNVADVLFDEAHNIFKLNNDINGMLSVIAGFIATKCMLGEYGLAIQWGIKGIELAEKNNNIERLIAMKGNLANIYIEIEEYEKAIEVLDEIDDLPWLGSNISKVALNNNRINCEIETDNLDKALNYLIKFNDIAREIPAFNIKWDIHRARIYIKNEEYLEAERLLNEIIDKYKKIEAYEFEGEVILCLTDIYLLKNEYKKVIKNLKSVEGSIEKSNILKFIRELYYKLNLCYKKIDDYKNAYFYLEKYMNIVNKINNIKVEYVVSTLDNQKEKMNRKDYKLLYNQNKILSEIGKEITINLNKRSIFNVIATQIKKFIEYDIIQIALYDEEINKYILQLVIEEDTIINLKNDVVEEDSFTSYSIRNKEDILINDVTKDFNKYILDYNKYIKVIEEYAEGWNNKKLTNSLVIIPMIIKNKVIGVINIQKYEKNAYGLKDLITLKTLSNYIGIALYNSILYKKVEYNANYDGLTDIYNRRRAIEKINKLRDKLKYNEKKFYLTIIDIDNFKKINDIYGHNTGDKVLKEVAKLLKNSIKKHDILGRYGGEEFILLIENRDGEIKNDIEKIREDIERLTIKDNGNKINVTVSIGVEVFDKKYNTLEENISLADKKLYKAKNMGKNKVVF